MQPFADHRIYLREMCRKKGMIEQSTAEVPAPQYCYAITLSAVLISLSITG